jgi:cobyrinic acid a,c-diamide synthase
VSAPSGAEAIATDAISCVLRAPTVSVERCREIASMAGTTVEGLHRAEHSVVDQLGEVIVRRARSERMMSAQRAGLARWFDLGMAAAREASVATAASRSASLQRARADEMTAGDLDAIESAAQRDTNEVRARAQLDALMAFARERLDGAAEAECIAIVVAMSRVDGARGAHEMTRSDSVQTSVDLAVDVAGAASVRALNERSNSGERAALRASTEAPSLDDASARLRVRASEVCVRASASVRQWCERSASR